MFKNARRTAEYYFWRQNILCDLAAIYGSNPKIAGGGIVRGLKEITVVPSDGWGKEADVVDNGGYVIMFTFDGVQKYVRLMVTTNRDATGEVIGINYSYQFFTPTNL